MENNRIAHRALSCLCFAVLTSLSLAQILELPAKSSLLESYLKLKVYPDGFDSQGRVNHFSKYPYFSIPDPTTDRDFGPFVPFLTGVTQFGAGTFHPNSDPILVVGGYNYGTTTGTPIVSSEPVCGLVLETNFLVPGDNYNRQMELYYTFRNRASSAQELRVFGFQYAPDTHQLADAGIMCASESYGGSFSFLMPEGGIYAKLGRTATNNGMNGFRLYGDPSRLYDTSIQIDAPVGRQSNIVLGSNGSVGTRIYTQSENHTIFQVSGNDVLHLYGLGGNKGAVGINAGDNSASLTVQAIDSGAPVIIARAAPGVVRNPVEIQSSGGAVLAGVSPVGAQIVNVGSKTAAGANSQTDATLLVEPFTVVTCDSVTKGVRLPAATTGIVYEGVWGSTDGNLYPSFGQKIRGAANNVSITMKANKSFRCVAISGSEWAVMISQ